MTDPLTYLGYPFAQRALVDLLLLAVIAGAIGPWVVMRSLAFFAHAVGTAAFPGLVIAAAVGAPLPLGAAAGAAATTVGAGIGRGRERNAARTGLWLSGSLAAGSLAAGALGSSGASVDSALFGSLLSLSGGDLALTATLAVTSVVLARTAGPRWLADGLLERRSRTAGTLLVLLVAAATIGQLSASGSLLATTLLVLPAVASRPWIRSVSGWQLATAAVAALSGLGGLALALAADLPAGASVSLVAGAATAMSLALRSLAIRGRIAVPALAAMAALAAGCGGDTPRDDNGPGGTGGKTGRIAVVATTPIVASLVEAIGGDRVKVRTMVPRGADPHDFEPRPSDIASVSGKGVLFANGGLDDWVRELRQRSGGSMRLVDLIDSAPVRITAEHADAHSDEGDGHDSGTDPHWFHDPRNVAAAGRTISAELSRLRPGQGEYFAARSSRLTRLSRALEQQGVACIRRLPGAQRSLVTDHDAFSYLAGRTGLTVVGTVIPSTSDSATASARHLDQLASTAKKLRINAIFPESALDPKTAKALASATGARADIQLDADTLGPPGSGRESWAGMWASNVRKIALGLSGGSLRCTIKASP